MRKNSFTLKFRKANNKRIKRQLKKRLNPKRTNKVIK